MTLTMKSDGVLEAVAAKLASAPEWMPRLYAQHLPWLGGRVADVMEGVLEKNRYTGDLQDSITSEYDAGQQEVTIGPTAMRGGRYDAGTLLELGVPHPVNVPWAPIAAWAEFRGLPVFPIWYKIRTVGIDAHPFLDRTLKDGQTQDAITETSKRIAVDAALEVASVQGVSSISVQQ